MKMTKLEKHLSVYFWLTVIKWIFWPMFILYCIYRVHFFGTFAGLLHLHLTSFRCCENGYIPMYHYFFRYRFSHSYEERKILNQQYESTAYTKIGEGAFLEDYLVFTDFGVILSYSEIKSISFRKWRNLNVVSVCLKNGKKYEFNISEAEYKSEPSLYRKALSHYQSKIAEKEEIRTH